MKTPLAISGLALGLLTSAALLAAPTASNSPSKSPSKSLRAGNPVLPLADPEAEPVKALPDIEQVFEDLDCDPNPKKIALGEKLFHDPRLSHDNTLSCASCHDLRYGGVDRAPTATGINSQRGPINTPTVFNAALSIAQFWDGRAANLQAQAGGPPLAAGEMGSTWPEIVSKINADASYVADFQGAYGDAVKSPADIKSDYILECISQFECTLITPDSPFDQWLAGDQQALSQDEYDGYQVFKSVGCTTCHYGSSVGGKSFQRLGAKRAYFADEGIVTHVDNGRYNVTKDDRDKHVFKVPSLRNVAVTGPWFHDGSKKTLDEAVLAMGKHQLDRDLSARETQQVVAFLKSLTGTFRGASLDQSLTSER
jgi:cytochrome c peroxidase